MEDARIWRNSRCFYAYIGIYFVYAIHDNCTWRGRERKTFFKKFFVHGKKFFDANNKCTIYMHSLRRRLRYCYYRYNNNSIHDDRKRGVGGPAKNGKKNGNKYPVAKNLLANRAEEDVSGRVAPHRIPYFTVPIRSRIRHDELLRVIQRKHRQRLWLGREFSRSAGEIL